MTAPDISSRIEKARALFEGSYNCSQSVALAFADIIGLNEEDILRVMSGFGYGMGGERTVCGSVSGGVFVISSTIKDTAVRDDIYEKVFYLINEFKSHNNGNIDCLNLVGENPDKEDFHRICPDLIEQVVRAVAEILEEKQ